MMRYLLAFLLLWGTPAVAQDKLIESMIPEAIAQVMRAEGYTADVKRRDNGTPYIAAKKEDWTFTVEFYNCDAIKGCESAQFFTWYKKDAGDTIQRVNEWNATKRFLKVALDEEGDLQTTMDVSLLGKLTYVNLADLLDWWVVMASEAVKFFPEDPKDTKPATEKK